MNKTLALVLMLSAASAAFAGGKIKVACVGDSITEGFGIPAAKRKEFRWPSVLQKLLGDKYEVGNFGSCGKTLLRDEGGASWCNTGHPKKLAKFKPDIIVVMLGTNDSKMKHWGPHKGNFEKDLKTLLAEFKKVNVKAKIYLCYPPPAFSGGNLSEGDGISGKRIRKEIVPIIEKVAKEEKLPTIDVFKAFQKHPELFADGVHPNIKGAAEFAELIAKNITKDKKKK